MPDAGLESWTSGLSPRERVREISTTLTQPRSVEWIRKEAGISSWEAAKDELEMLAEFDEIRAVEVDGNTKYAPNYQRRYFDELAELIEDHTREELREEVAAIQEEIEKWQSGFGVDSRRELESTLTDEGLSSEEIRARNRVLRQWERRQGNKRLLEHALALSDDACSISW